jgi:sugar lactone lactonase YvrE
VDLATGTITTVAGTGVAGFSGDGGPATAAQLSAPQQLAVGSGNLYIADTSNNRVRRVDLATGTITTFAGTGTSGFSGDGGPATAAQLNYPVGLAIGSGNLYISDQNNYRVRKVDLVTGIITTAVGTGVRGYSGDGGPAAAAQVGRPLGLALDSANLCIADYDNARIRKVDLTTGIITTVAGMGVMGFSGDGGPAEAAQLYGPNAVALDSANLYISDSFNNRVRRVSLR